MVPFFKDPFELVDFLFFTDESQMTRGTFVVSETTETDDNMMLAIYIGFGVTAVLLIILIVIGFFICSSVRSTPQPRRLNRA